MKIGNIIKDVDFGWSVRITGDSLDARVTKSISDNVWLHIFPILNTRLRYVYDISPSNYKLLTNFCEYVK